MRLVNTFVDTAGRDATEVVDKKGDHIWLKEKRPSYPAQSAYNFVLDRLPMPDMEMLP